MKKPIIFSVLFFIITAISSFGQDDFLEGSWIEENINPETGLRTGKVEFKSFFFEEDKSFIFDIKPNAEFNDEEFGITPSFQSFDLSNVDLSGANLSNLNLTEANLSGAILKEANLKGTVLKGANLERTNLEGTNLAEIISGNIIGAPSSLPDNYEIFNGFLLGPSIENKVVNGFVVGPSVDLVGADLSGVDLSGFNLARANLSRTNLRGANLTGTILSLADFTGANLSVAILKSANIENASLFNATLNGADLSEANLSYANMTNTQVSGANLSKTNLTHANLTNSNLTGANLTEANLSYADLEYAELYGADLSGADLSKALVAGSGWAFWKNQIGTFVTALNKSYYQDIQLLKTQIAEGGIGGGISPEQAAAITSNTEGVNEVKNAIFIGGSSIIPALLSNDQEQRNSIAANTTKINELDGVLTTADETLEAFSQNLDVLNENDQ